MDPATISTISLWVKFFSDMAIDMYIEKQQEGYTPDQLKAMVTSEETRKKTLDAAWQEMKANAGL